MAGERDRGKMDDQIPELHPGDKIKNKYIVTKKLGEGGFGAVYLVEDSSNRAKHAMKIETAKAQIQVLKMEVVVLTEVMERGGRHVCKIYDRGRNDSFNYVVMTCVGQSLGDLRKACSGSRFTTGTALRAGIQCMEAIEELHKIGYLHRDVKPGNFAIGREEVREQRIIYILDFGLSRKYINDRGVIRTPRQAAGFRGTVRYAPLNCHQSCHARTTWKLGSTSRSRSPKDASPGPPSATKMRWEDTRSRPGTPEK